MTEGDLADPAMSDRTKEQRRQHCFDCLFFSPQKMGVVITEYNLLVIFDSEITQAF